MPVARCGCTPQQVCPIGGPSRPPPRLSDEPPRRRDVPVLCQCRAGRGKSEPPPPQSPEQGVEPSPGTPPCVTDWSGAGPGATLPCDPTCLAAQPVHAPHPPAARAPHTHRYGGISLPRVPPRGTGAVISPVGLETGQPSTHRTSCDAQGRATSVVPEVRMRP